MLVAVHSCSPDAAWSALVTASQRHNGKVAVLAAQLLAVTQGHEPVPDADVRQALAELVHRAPAPGSA